MNASIAFIIIAVYITFLLRFAWQAVLWFRISSQPVSAQPFLTKLPRRVCLSSLLDIIFFRRIFSSSKCLWIGSWTFHLTFLFVLLGHLRFFFRALPDCLILLQPVSVLAGYILPPSLFYLMALRVFRKKDRYASSYNYFISGLLLFISATGLLMRNFSKPDLVAVKDFTLGVLGFQPQALPADPVFIIHGAVFLILLPYLPTHIIAAPFTNLEANKRTEELRFIIHDQ